MVWQDIVITFANLVFVISLVPQIIYGYKNKKGYIKLETSVPTFLALYSMSIAFFTLNLFYSCIAVFMGGTCWLILAIQRFIYKKA